MKFHYDHKLNGNRMSLVHGGFESVFAYCFDGLLIEPHAEVAYHVDVLRITLAVNDDLNGNAALEIGRTSFRREFGIHGMNDRGRTDAAAYTHYATAISAAASGTVSDTVTGADAATKT